MWISKQQQQQRQVRPEAPGTVEPATSKSISMYEEPPGELVTIEEFEGFALERLKVLKGLENDKARGFKYPQLQEKAKLLLSKHLSGKGSEGQRKDCISHFVLRLAYCRSDELRRWFLSQECDLFKYRFNLEPTTNQAAFMRRHELPIEILDPTELEELKPELIQVLNSLNLREVAADVARGPATDMYYKVPWEQVLDLVAGRRVLLRAGMAYVHKRDIGSLVVSHFRARLSKALALTARKWASQLSSEEADRLTPVVEALSVRYLGPDFSGDDNGPKDTITYSQLPGLAQQSFPLCMQNMYNHVHEDHHIKHGGRQQLGLFLKGIGLPLEEALRFWRTEFGPRTPADAFDKQYAYNVRFNYGKEGKRTDYTPYSCLKVISSTPGQGDHHGCPYKVWGREQLGTTLSRMRIAPIAVEGIVAKAKAGHYQLACAMAFEGKHNCSCDTGINHPNQYFVESREVFAAKDSDPSTPGQPQAIVKLQEGTPGIAPQRALPV